VANRSHHAPNPRNNPTVQIQLASASENYDGSDIGCKPIRTIKITNFALSRLGPTEIQNAGVNIAPPIPSMSNPRQFSGMRKKKGQRITVDLYILVVECDPVSIRFSATRTSH